jgi:hypothetical protein
MRIRDLKWKDVPMWPPEWWITDQGSGEEGLLEVVNLRKDKSPACIVVVADHLGADRRGIIILEDLTRLDILYHKLKENIGKSLREIGEMEIDFRLPIEKMGQKQARPRSMADISKKNLKSTKHRSKGL